MRLSGGERRRLAIAQVLAQAPDVYLLHPDMKEVPKPLSLSGARQAPPEHLAWLGADSPFNESARLLAELGMNDGVSRPLWIHLELPAEAPTLEFITGQVTNAEGEVLSNFEIDAVPLNSQYGKAYHLSFPLEEGAYTVDLVGGDARDVEHLPEEPRAGVVGVEPEATEPVVGRPVPDEPVRHAEHADDRSSLEMMLGACSPNVDEVGQLSASGSITW